MPEVTRIRWNENEARRPDRVPEGSVVTVLRVPPESAGMRLDLFVQTQLKRTSRTRTQIIVKRSAFDAEGNRLAANDRVFAEQRVLLWREPWDELAVPTDLPVIYEDEHLFAISKPAGVPVHPTARYHRNTVVKLLAVTRQGEYFTLAHRLDRETSGVLLARQDRARPTGASNGSSRDERPSTSATWRSPGALPHEDALRVDLPLELDQRPASGCGCASPRPARGSRAATRIHRPPALPARRARLRARAVRSRNRTPAPDSRAPRGDSGARLWATSSTAPIPSSSRAVRIRRSPRTTARALELERHALHAWRHVLRPSHFRRHRIAIEAPIAADMAAFWRTLDPAYDFSRLAVGAIHRAR